MCGIGAILQQVQIDAVVEGSQSTGQSDDTNSYSLNVEELISVISPRGPDYCGVAQIIFDSDGSVVLRSDAELNNQVKPSLTLVGCVLSMRGEGGLEYIVFLTFKVTSQPMINKQSNVLLWNGEIFDSNNKELQVQQHQNDGLVLFEALSKVEDDISIPSLLQDIKGPWAIVYWQVGT